MDEEKEWSVTIEIEVTAPDQTEALKRAMSDIMWLWGDDLLEAKIQLVDEVDENEDALQDAFIEEDERGGY